MAQLREETIRLGCTVWYGSQAHTSNMGPVFKYQVVTETEYSNHLTYIIRDQIY